MYLKLVLATCALAFFAVVLSAYARLSEAGLGCEKWPACYEENAVKDRQASEAGTAQGHISWQWKLHSQVVQLLGIMVVAVWGLSWKKRRELRQSPLLPTLLLGLLVFLAVFGALAIHKLPHPVIVTVHLAGGVAMMALLISAALGLLAPVKTFSVDEAKFLRPYSWLGFGLLFLQIVAGGWVSSNFAALACADFPLCNGSILPPMEFAHVFDYSVSTYSPTTLTAIHWMHRIGALVTLLYLGWLSVRIMSSGGGRKIGSVILGLVGVQAVIGGANILAGLPLAAVIVHNALAMLLLATLVLLLFRVQNCLRPEPH